ncbi:MAG: type VII toxin-antitoxin system MntA family adenylyltransferase antitoxin [Gemmatimonadota bacterium]
MPETADPGFIELLAEAAGPRAEVAAAYVYGSVARGEATSLSDIDIALLFSEDAPESLRHDVIVQVASGLAHTAVGKELDVRDIEELPLVVQGRILTEGRLVRSNDDVRRVRFETSTRMRYFDFLPFHVRDVEEGLRSLRRRFGG